MLNFDPISVDLLSAELESLGHCMRRGKPGSATGTSDRRFRAWFGVSPMVAAKCWLLLVKDPDFENSTRSKEHRLWALMLMKDYGNIESLAANASVDEKTFSRHAWHYVDLISDLQAEVVSSSVLCSF
jgi:hypothetical protein